MTLNQNVHVGSEDLVSFPVFQGHKQTEPIPLYPFQDYCFHRFSMFMIKSQTGEHEGCAVQCRITSICCKFLSDVGKQEAKANSKCSIHVPRKKLFVA